MALKYISDEWKDDMRINPYHDNKFYINPRNRVFPAQVGTGVTYIKNDPSVNMRGTYRMQTGATTDLYYTYQLPQRFIIEGWFKPEFAYDDASNTDIIGNTIASPYSDLILLRYNGASKIFIVYILSGSNSFETVAYTSTVDLNKWIYIRIYVDKTAGAKACYMVQNQVSLIDSQLAMSTSTNALNNNLIFFNGLDCESSYWIIHELDETLASGEYKTYNADRQIIFDFNGTTNARERLDITRFVKSYNVSKKLNGANSVSLSINNTLGQFSDDQYDAFDPFNGYYNGTQKYLQNRCSVEIESRSPSGTIYGNVSNIWSKQTFATTDLKTGTDAPDATHYALYQLGGWDNTKISIENGMIKVSPTNASNIFRINVDGRSKCRLIRIKVPTACTLSFNSDSTAVSKTFQANVFATISTGTIDSGGNSIADIENFPVGDSYIMYDYIGVESNFINKIYEPLFIGRTTSGAFKRNSSNNKYGIVAINAEDGISELGESKLKQSYAFDTYDLSDPASEATSLIHAIPKLVTKKEIKNYCGNSSFENTTIGNSWVNSGLATMERSNTYSQFGTYSIKCIATAAGQWAQQKITFQGNDKLDVGDVINFSAYVREDASADVSLYIIGQDSSDTSITNNSIACSGSSNFNQEYLSITVTSGSIVKFLLLLHANKACTFYVDGVMLTRGIDPIDYFIENSTDGSSGVCNADNAMSVLYDTIAIDAEAVDVSHPYAVLKKGDTTWDHIKDISDASIASYCGMSDDGVFIYRVRYNELNEDNLGDVEDVAAVGTVLENSGINSIEVRGIQIQKETATKTLYSGNDSGQFVTAERGLFHPISNGQYLSIAGSTDIELQYKDD